MEVSDNRRCIVCGPENPIGLKVRPQYDRESGRAWLTTTLPADFQGWAGVAHGGVIAALLDEVSAYAAMSESRQIVTAELTVRYLKPVPLERELFVEAQVRDRVRRSITVEAVMTCEGEAMARATARMVVLKSPSAA